MYGLVQCEQSLSSLERQPFYLLYKKPFEVFLENVLSLFFFLSQFFLFLFFFLNLYRPFSISSFVEPVKGPNRNSFIPRKPSNAFTIKRKFDINLKVIYLHRDVIGFVTCSSSAIFNIYHKLCRISLKETAKLKTEINVLCVRIYFASSRDSLFSE